MTPETKKEIFNHLFQVAKTQLQVRHCEIEGMVYPLEQQLDSVLNLGLISLFQHQLLIDILHPPKESTNDSSRNGT